MVLQGSSAATTSGPGPGPWFLPAADKPQQELNEFSAILLNNSEPSQQRRGLSSFGVVTAVCPSGNSLRSSFPSAPSCCIWRKCLWIQVMPTPSGLSLAQLSLHRLQSEGCHHHGDRSPWEWEPCGYLPLWLQERTEQ